MRRPAYIAGVAVLALAAASGPAVADSPAKVVDQKIGRYTRLDSSTVGKVTGLPRYLTRDKTVSALVQIAGTPVATRQAKAKAAGRKFTAKNRKTALAAVADAQDAVIPDLKAAGAKVTGRLSTVVNAVRITAPASKLAKIADVDGVVKVQVSHTVTRQNAAAATYTGVPTAWQDLKVTGKGITVGVIDDGIDYTHADFGGPGTTAAYDGDDHTVIEAGTFPTAKVVGGYDFVGDAYDAGGDTTEALTPVPDPDPIGCGEHGTHVSGSIAGQGVTTAGATFTGPYNAKTLTATSFTVPPGMAPQAKLRAYKVFGCEGSVNDDIIVAAIDKAAADGVNIINMSLGSSFGTENGIDQTAIANATAAGVLVVVSAGNEGAGAYLVGGPSTATTALSVAAMDATSPTIPAVAVTGAVTQTLQQSNDIAVTSEISGELVDVGLGCDAADYAGAAGKIVVSTRGTCDRVARAQLGDAAGAKAVILVNNADGLPPQEGPIDGVDIPFLGATPEQGAALIAAVGQTVTLAGGATLDNPSWTDNADFTSNGPRRLDSAPKPDVAAPGVSIISAGRGTGTGYFTLSGTSMAAPVTTGIAALVRQAHPTWNAKQVKAAIQSNAKSTLLGDYSAVRDGTGVVSAAQATAAKAYAWTSNDLNALAFGFTQTGSSLHQAKAYKVTNKSSKTIVYKLSTDLTSDTYGAKIAITPKTLTVPAGATRYVQVDVTFSKAAIAALPSASASDNGVLASLNGAIVATPTKAATGVYPLRTAFLSVVKGLSAVTAKYSASAKGIIARNAGTHAGTADVYAWQISDPKGDTADAETPDVTTAGVQQFDDGTDKLIVFAVGSAKGTSTQATNEYDVVIDADRDGTPDYIVFQADYGLVAAGGYADGTLGVFVYDLKAGAYVDIFTGSGPMNGSLAYLPVLASDLGVTGAFDWAVSSYTTIDTQPSDDTTTATFDPFHEVVTTGGYETLASGASAVIPATVDTTQTATQTAKGWLVLTPDDKAGADEATTVALPTHP